MSGIQMALLGAGGINVTITLNNQTISDLETTSAYAYYFLTAGGLVQQSLDGGGINPTTLETWCVPTSQAANYEARVTVTSGLLSGGSAAGTWLPLSSTRNWYVEQLAFGVTQCIFTVEIQRTGTSVILASASITLQAEVL